MSNIIDIKNISKSFTNSKGVSNRVLYNLNLEVEQDEFLAIRGPSGAGKSTLLYLLGMVDSPDAGAISYNIDGKNVNPLGFNDKKLSEFRNRNIGFIFQFYYLLPEFSSLENVMIPALISGKSYNQAETLARELIDKVGLQDRLHNKPSELSGGEQQRIAIARALINQPKIILADEPTGNLDTANSKMVIELLFKIKREYSVTFVIATHSEDIANAADKVLMLRDGKLNF